VSRKEPLYQWLTKTEKQNRVTKAENRKQLKAKQVFAENALLIKLWSDSTLGVDEIAEKLHISPGTVSQRANRLGLPKRRPLEFALWSRGTPA